MTRYGATIISGSVRVQSSSKMRNERLSVGDTFEASLPFKNSTSIFLLRTLLRIWSSTSAIVTPGIIRKLIVIEAFCGSTFAAGLPSAIVTPVVVRISDAAGGIFFITNVTSGFKSHRLQVTMRAG